MIKKIGFALMILSLLASASASAHANTQNFGGFCNAVRFRRELIKENAFSSIDYYRACKRWVSDRRALPVAIPIIFSSFPQRAPVIIGLDHLEGVAPQDLRGLHISEKTQRASFNATRFYDLFDSAPIYQERAGIMLDEGGALATKVVLKMYKTTGGNYVRCRINFFNEKTKRRWHESHFVFYAKKNIVVSYSTWLMNDGDSADELFLQALDSLFKSMRSNRAN